ncbi:FAD-dependent oxidoreductase [Solimicrobium silvestre]|uniref:Glycine/D-amino acid oxidases (Deaminating) n=1 Tax=Solimicrobium silvestre TaxID=2099400 RepID=A0A2S9GVB4_9BURK|nr:FAD-dependent oxidoreductase [Solimicrobium silvestre]PRC91654.1 Glycine/D-amino acid oxidases (deaminating) [Solimicrobium silvestre]
MRVAVIGAGVVGVTTAYFLAQNGHQVSVIEQRGNVSEEASLGHAGLLGAAHLTPFAAPGMPKQILSHFFKTDGAINLRPSVNVTHWRWLRSWLRECSLEGLLANKEKMQRLGRYSQQLLSELSHSHNLDFQQRSGILQLFRNVKEQKKIIAGLALLSDADLPFQQLDTAACHQLEPALNKDTSLAGGLYLPQDGNGNCVLFTKQLKLVAQQLGVEFEFLTKCEQIIPNKNGATLHLKKAEQTGQQQFDAVVLASGASSTPFLKNIGINLRIAQFQSYSNTANIKNLDDSPRLSIIDESEQIAITRMDKRIRIAGTLHLGKRKNTADERAWQKLRNVGTDWFPDAANYHTGQNWSGHHLMLSDSTPVLGRSAVKNIFVNCAHAEYGWAMATGSGKILADLISGKSPEIDLDGLTVLR